MARLREDTGHDVIVQPLELNPSSADSIAAGVARLRETRDQKVLLGNLDEMAVRVSLRSMQGRDLRHVVCHH